MRVNQVGYATGCSKEAVVMADHPLDGSAFRVLDERNHQVVLSGRVGVRRPAFNRHWRYVYLVDFSALRTRGSYLVELAGTGSPRIRIDDPAALYRPLVADAVSFFHVQRDGSQVLGGPIRRVPSHLRDAHARVYAMPTYKGLQLVGRLTPTGERVDVSGGWFDAGDYLKFVESASFADVALLFALRQYAHGVPDVAALRAEARFGIDWLERMWQQSTRVLYYQVGIGDGNGSSILGDHDLWRLPQADDANRARPAAPSYFVVNRPVFAANAPGGSISPNLAGRVAAAFALCAQVFAQLDPAYAERCLLDGQTVFDLARAGAAGQLLTSSPHGYYDEPDWRDDMELGATELFLATNELTAGASGLPHPDASYYLVPATRWGDAYAANPKTGTDSFNLYDVSTLADFDLIGVLRDPAVKKTIAERRIKVHTTPYALLVDRHDQLALATLLSSKEAFALANPATNLDTVTHALGYAIEARMYDKQTGTARYERFAARQINWVLGGNPWGSSFVVGSGAVYPHCLAHQVANLSGSLTGTGAILRGATVNGPTDLSELTGLGTPDGSRRCPQNGRDPFNVLNGERMGYLDVVGSSNTSEPSIDSTALMLLAAAQQAAGG